MPQIPDASQLGARSIPQSNRGGIVSFDGGAGARGMIQAGQEMQQAGARLDAKAQQEKEAQEKLNKANALLELKKLDLQHDEYMKANPQDYLKFDEVRQKAWAEAVPKVKKQFGIADPLFDVAASEDYLIGKQRVSAYADGRRKEFIASDVAETSDIIIKTIRPDMGDDERRSALMTAYAKLDGYANTMGADWVTNQKIQLRNNFDKTYYNTKLSTDGAAKEVFDATKPLSVRNNNPGNLRAADGAFRQFATPEEGIAAMRADLTAKVTGNSPAMKSKLGGGYSPTIRNIISVYAPSSENDTEAYINTVAKESGLNPDTPLAPGDVDKIMKPMIKVEGGSASMAKYSDLFSPDPDILLAANKQAEAMLPAQAATMIVNMPHEDAIKLLDTVAAGQRTNTVLDDIKQEDLKKIVPGVIDSFIATDPQGFMASIKAGRYDKILSPADKVKYQDTAIKAFQAQQEREQNIRLADASTRNADLYSKFIANDPNTLSEIAKFRASASDPKDIEFADDLQRSYVKANPVPAEEAASVYNDLFASFVNMQIGRGSASGKTVIKNSDVKLEDVVRLQQDAMKAAARGITSAKDIVNKLTPAIQLLAGKELGVDDVGLFESAEIYDAGYQVVQDYLEKKDKQNDMALKAQMLSDFIVAADAIPDAIRKDQKVFNSELSAIANATIINAARKGGAQIQPDAIRYLMDNPDTAPQFDSIFGVGSASKVLGGK